MTSRGLHSDATPRATRRFAWFPASKIGRAVGSQRVWLAGFAVLGLAGAPMPLAKIQLNGFLLPAPPRFVAYEHTLSLLSTPFGWAWVGLMLVLGLGSQLRVVRGASRWLPALACAVGIAGCVQTASMTSFAFYWVIPTTTFHSDCSVDLPLSSPAGLQRGCHGNALGNTFTTFLDSTVAAHPRLDSLGNYLLRPGLGWWLFAIDALLMATLGAYATFRLRLSTLKAVALESLLLFGLGVMWAVHVGGVIAASTS